MEKLKEKLFEELDEISRKPEMGAGDLEVIHKLTDTIKNIDKICMLEEESGYSQDGGDGGSYGNGSSYANRGKHYVRGHYSRDGGGSYNGGGQGGYSSRRGGSRGGRGGYSRDDGRSEMMEHLEMAMDTATDQDRETIKRFMRQLENA